MDIAAILLLVSRGVELAQKLFAEGRTTTTAEETAGLLASQAELESAYKQLYPDSPLPGPQDAVARDPVAPPTAIQI